MNHKIIDHTPFGPIVILWDIFENQPKIIKILLSKPDYSAAIQLQNDNASTKSNSCGLIDYVSHQLILLLKGQDVQFSLDHINLNQCPPFQQKILKAEHAIPRGEVSTYQLIGKYIGKLQSARAVGNALANNPFPLIIPCHRAIRTNLSLGGYQGGLKMKRSLLEKEGIQFDCKGHVKVNKLHYDP